MAPSFQDGVSWPPAGPSPAQHAPENALFERFRANGDAEALGELYDRLAPGLYRLALSMGVEPGAAEDLLQATFLVALERAATFEAGRPVGAWLTGILQHKVRELRARRAALRAREGSPHDSGEPLDAVGATRGGAPPEDHAHLRELRETLARELERLPEDWRPVLVLRIEHGLSATQIAHALDRPAGTVRSQLARGLERLRRLLPAGLAGALAVTLGAPARGLDAVRGAVLSAAQAQTAVLATASAPALTSSVAASTPAAGSLAALALTLVAMPKTLLAAGALASVALAALLVTVDPTTGSASPEVAAAPAPDPAPELVPVDPPSALAPPTRAERAELLAAVAPLELVEPGEAGDEPPLADSDLEVRVAREAGGPVADALVLVTAPPRGSSASEELRGRTDEDGRAHFPGLPPGMGFVRGLRAGQAGVQLAPGEKHVVELTLRVGMTARGRVVDASGSPLVGAEVLVSERWRDDTGYVAARTERAGGSSSRA